MIYDSDATTPTGSPEGPHQLHVHTPNRDGYSNVGGAVVIPHVSHLDRHNSGFRKLSSNTSVIDPNPDGSGGLPIDMRRVTPKMSQWAYAEAAKQTDDPQARRLLGYKLLAEAIQKAAGKTETMAVPTQPVALPGISMKKVTKFGAGPSTTPPVANATPAPAAATATATAAPASPAATAAPPVSPPVSYPPEFSDLLRVLAATVMSRVAEPVTPVAVTPPAAASPVTEAIVAPSAGTPVFDLGIPNLGSVPEKPRYNVKFDMGELGQLSAKYHWILLEGNCLLLVYDTRFENGTEYIPPKLSRSFSITCTGKDAKAPYEVRNPGFTVNFGTFLLIMLEVVTEAVSQPEPTASDQRTLGDLLDD